MPSDIKCPSCGHQFEPNEAIRDEVEKELRSKAADWQKKKNEEFQLKLEDERRKIQQALESDIRKNIGNDYENKLRLLEENKKENEEKLRSSRQKELEFMRKEQDLINQHAEFELSVQKKVQEEREKMGDEIRKIEEQRTSVKETEFQLRLKEMEEKLEAQKKLADEMRRRAEIGSQQLKGEVQELALEQMLRLAFPFDEVTEVGKGIKGADCVLTIKNKQGQPSGKIIFESKRAVNFINDWIDKLRSDMRSVGADVAVLVTQAFPKDMDRMGEKNGVWICSFHEVKAVVQMLRDGIIKVSDVLKHQENKGDKMTLLYDYLTSSEFKEQWKAIREGFMSMKLSIQRERDAMEKLWKAREKQLEKVLLNAAHVRGSIEGIAGMDSVDLNLIEEGDDADI